MSLEEIDEFLSPTLDLRVRGREYRIPSPPALIGLRLQAGHAINLARAAGKTPLSKDLRIVAEDDYTTSLEQDALGPVWDQMIADGVDYATLMHAGMTAYLWIVAGMDAARRWWVMPLGGVERPLPEDPAPTTSTDVETTTPPPVSTTTTTSPQTPHAD